jgi:ParB-like chromosome segregation protein Spo0J
MADGKKSKFEPMVEMWPARKIKPYERNAMIHSDGQIEELVESMKTFGWTMPMLVEPDGTIIAGHGRFEASKVLRQKSVPVIVARGWSETMRRQYRLADNQLGRKSKWDPDKLFAELQELKEIGSLEATGFTLREFEGLKPLEDQQQVGGGPQSKPEFQVIVICPGEESQRDLLDRLTGEGFKCKALMR